ncbi:hypothetical protein M2140_000380 [Clostridiales Family XIII bacterium PM5-7]
MNKAIDLYYNTFIDSFPMFPMMGVPQNEVVEIINKCILEKKDIYDLGYLTLDDGIMY